MGLKLVSVIFPPKATTILYSRLHLLRLWLAALGSCCTSWDAGASWVSSWVLGCACSIDVCGEKGAAVLFQLTVQASAPKCPTSSGTPPKSECPNASALSCHADWGPMRICTGRMGQALLRVHDGPFAAACLCSRPFCTVKANAFKSVPLCCGSMWVPRGTEVPRASEREVGRVNVICCYY